MLRVWSPRPRSNLQRQCNSSYNKSSDSSPCPNHSKLLLLCFCQINSKIQRELQRIKDSLDFLQKKNEVEWDAIFTKPHRSATQAHKGRGTGRGAGLMAQPASRRDRPLLCDQGRAPGKKRLAKTGAGHLDDHITLPTALDPQSMAPDRQSL